MNSIPSCQRELRSLKARHLIGQHGFFNGYLVGETERCPQIGWICPQLDSTNQAIKRSIRLGCGI